MKKRILSLLLALLLFTALPVMGLQTYAAGETVKYTIGAETMKMICAKNGLDYDFCWRAILQLNPTEFDASEGENAFTSLVYGTVITLPKTNQDAAALLGTALPARLQPSSSAASSANTISYTVKGGDTMISICSANKLSFAACKAAIMKLNNFASDYSFLTLKAGMTILLPKSDAEAATIAASTAASSSTASASTASTTSSTATVSTVLPSGSAVAAYMVPHTVQAGETIYGICQANDIDFSKYGNLIMQASGVTYASGLHSGDVIYIPSSSAVSGAFSIVMHTVSAGETTTGICQALGVNYADNLKLITALNPGKNLSNIHTGDILLFPKKA